MFIYTDDYVKSIDVGTQSFLDCFYLTIISLPDNDKYKITIDFLKSGHIGYGKSRKCIRELEDIREKFKNFTKDDIKNLSRKFPLNNNIGKNIKDLSEYFVTADGKELVKELIKIMIYSRYNCINVSINESMKEFKISII